MTSDMDAGPTPPATGGGTAHGARREAGRVGQETKQAAGHVAHEAVDQGRQVAAQTGQQARGLVTDVSRQARTQAQEQQQRAVESLRTLGTQLRSMADDGADQNGLAAQVVRRSADAAEQAAGWLGSREPGDLVREVRDYASRHPGTFLAGAAIAGLLAGRLTRSLTGGGPGGGGTPTSEGPSPMAEGGLHVRPSTRAAAPLRHGPDGTEVAP
jgi:hypothetical protein